MTENLRKKTFKGIVWSYVSKFGTQIAAILPAMILTRLLEPSDYGLIAMTGIFTGIAFLLADGGFGTALIQKKDADHLDYCSVFYFNLSVHILMYICVFFAAPYCASYFNEERLTPIIRISALNLVFLAIGNIHANLLKKQLEFKKPAIRNITVQIISAVIAILLAFAGYGVWALVVQGLCQTLMGSIANWMISNWRPTMTFSFSRIRQLFKFGSNILLSGVIGYVLGRVYDIIIGKYYSSKDLALYNRGFTTAAIFSDSLSGMYTSVAFPLFSKMQSDKQRLLLNVRRFVIISCMVMFPVTMVMIVLASPFITFMYSSKWILVIPFFQLVCIMSLFSPIIGLSETMLLALGSSDKYLILSIIRRIFFVIAALITWRYGIIYMLLGQIVCRMIEVLILNHFIREKVNYSMWKFAKDLVPYTFISLLIMATAYGVDYLTNSLLTTFHLHEMIHSAIRLIVCGGISISLFLLIYIRTGLYGYKELLLFVNDSIGSNSFLHKLAPKGMAL